MSEEELEARALQLDQDFAAWRGSLTFAEVAELRLYQATGYLTTNPLLRDEVSVSAYDEQALARLERAIAVIDSAISKGSLLSELVVYRGLQDPRTVFGIEDIGSLAGQVFSEPAFSSTSLNPEVALGMTVTASHPVLVELQLAAKQPAAWLHLAGDRRRRREYELLLPRRLSITIHEVDETAAVPVIRGSVMQ